MTTWYAGDLGCALLRDLVVWSSESITDRAAVFVEAGEPSADLFTLKRAYRQVDERDISGRALPMLGAGK